MLVLMRKKNEEIVIVTPDGVEIVVLVVDQRGDKTRLGVEAPRAFQVHRAEVWETIKRQAALDRLAGGAVK